MAEYYIDVLIEFPAMSEPQKLRVTPRLALLLHKRMEHTVVAGGYVVYRQPSTPLSMEEAASLSHEVQQGLRIEGFLHPL
jgi:hypothetical protein